MFMRENDEAHSKIQSVPCRVISRGLPSLPFIPKIFIYICGVFLPGAVVFICCYVDILSSKC